MNSDNLDIIIEMKKILICSDPNGNFDLLLPKVTELHSKNKFNFMVMVGRVCPSASSPVMAMITSKKLQFPLPTYFIDQSDMSMVFATLHPNGFQLFENFTYLGNLGTIEIQGVRIAFLSGKIKNTSNLARNDQSTVYQFNKIDAKKLIDNCADKQIDILLTNEWAQQYDADRTDVMKSQIISQVCFELSPRYHIAAGGGRYCRLPPFKGKKGNATHFINVAEIKQSLPKDKYLVAIQVNLAMPEAIANISQNPFIKSVDWNIAQIQSVGQIKNSVTLIKNKQSEKNQQKTLDANSFIMFEGFPQQTPNSQITQFLQKWGQVKEIQVFKKFKNNKKSGIVRFVNLKDAEICLKDSGKYTMYQSRIKFEIKHQNQKYRLKDCFLCMGNQKFDQSLVVYKGQNCFVAIDKGPIVEDHMQIVPINHASCTSQLQKQQQQEIGKIKNLIGNYFNSKKMTLVCIERYMNLSSQINHAILHCIGLPLDQQQVMLKFKQINYNNKFGFQKLDEANRSDRQRKDDSPYYILITINSFKFLKHINRKDKKFEQARQIVCQIIEKPERLNWRDCQMQPPKIKQKIQQLKKLFI